MFGNAAAGWRGAVFGGLLNGLVLAFGQWIGWGLYSTTAPELATLADPDWYAVGWVLLGLAKLVSGLGPNGLWIIAGTVATLTALILTIINRRALRETNHEDKEVTT